MYHGTMTIVNYKHLSMCVCHFYLCSTYTIYEGFSVNPSFFSLTNQEVINIIKYILYSVNKKKLDLSLSLIRISKIRPSSTTSV